LKRSLLRLVRVARWATPPVLAVICLLALAIYGDPCAISDCTYGSTETTQVLFGAAIVLALWSAAWLAYGIFVLLRGPSRPAGGRKRAQDPRRPR
jgi:hypothetical protein